MTRANDCVPSLHAHVGQCQRRGYENGRKDLVDQIEALHPPHVEQSGKTACPTCLVDYPCPTIRATQEDPS